MENGVPTFAMVSMLKNLCVGKWKQTNVFLERCVATVMVVCVVQYWLGLRRDGKKLYVYNILLQFFVFVFIFLSVHLLYCSTLSLQLRWPLIDCLLMWEDIWTGRVLYVMVCVAYVHYSLHIMFWEVHHWQSWDCGQEKSWAWLLSDDIGSYSNTIDKT